MINLPGQLFEYLAQFVIDTYAYKNGGTLGFSSGQFVKKTPIPFVAGVYEVQAQQRCFYDV